MISFGKYSKTITAVVGAVFIFWSLVEESARDSISNGEWRTGAIALAVALGVYTVANTGSS